MSLRTTRAAGRLLPGLVVVALAATAGFLLGRDDATGQGAEPQAVRPAETAPRTGPAAATAAPGAGPQTPPGRAVAPLPPMDMPLHQQADALVARAEAGDAAAACRLALELLDCRAATAAYASLDAPLRATLHRRAHPPLDASNRPDPAYVQPPVGPAERDAQPLVRRLRSCSGDHDLQRRAGHWLRQAARAGHPDAVLRYAAGQHYEPAPSGLLADPAFDDWRREAVAMLERAFAAGDPRAVELLRRAHADDASVATALVVDDPERAHAYAVLLARLRDMPEPPPLADAEADARARRLAGDWHAERFALATGVEDFMLMPSWERPADDAAKPTCESLR